MIKSRRMIWAGHVARMERNDYSFLVGNSEGKRPLRRSGCRREDNIKMDLREKVWGIMDWIYQAWRRDQWRAVVNLWIP
jgi:hypothetical protein